MTNIEIPNSVTSIGDYAFSGCDRLTSIEIPNSVTSIGDKAFYYCSLLSTINWNAKNCTLESGAAFDESVLSNLIIGEGVVRFPTEFFGKDITIYDVEFNSVNYTNSFFVDTTSCEIAINDLIIGGNVTSIKLAQFADCKSIRRVLIPEQVISIGYYAFEQCENLVAIIVNVNNKYYSSIDGVLFNKDGTTLIAYPAGKTGEYKIPNTVTTIERNAFYECGGLTSIEIPNSVTSIERSAFSYCDGLTHVTIPNSVTSIGESAFSSCSGLTSVTIGNNVTTIGNSAFYGCTGLTSVEIPNSVIELGSAVFRFCTNLVKVNIPSSVTTIGTGVFSFTEWYNQQPDGIVYLDNCCLSYKGDNAMGTLTIKEGTRLIADGAFFRVDGSGLTSIEIPNSVTSIGEDAFYGCTGLTSIEIPNSVTSIGEDAFYGCTGLTSIEIPNSVTSIGVGTFSHCSCLTSVTIPNSVTSIGVSAFNSCSSLTSITFPKNVTAIGSFVLEKCVSLKELEYNAINYTGKIENIFGIPEGSIALDKLIIGEDVTVIPEGLLGSGLLVKELEYNSAIGCSLQPISANIKSLEKIHIGERVKKLPSFAFAECETLTTLVYDAENCESIGETSSGFGTYPNLRNLTIGKDVKTIPANIFSGCSFLAVNVPDNVTSIGVSAFKDNTYLLNLSLGKSLKTISDNAFNNCYNLRSIDSKNTTPPVCGKGVFANVQTLACKLNVPTESVPLYQTAFAWIDFWNIAGKDFSGVEETFMDDAEEPAEYYNLQGVKIDNPEKGIYIKRQGGKSTKVVL